MRLAFATALLALVSACAMPMPSVEIPPRIAATLTQQERAAIAGNYAYVGEPESVVNLTPAFQASQIQDTQTIDSPNGETEIDTYESDTFALMSVVAECTVIYMDTDSDTVTLVNSYSTDYDPQYTDHGC